MSERSGNFTRSSRNDRPTTAERDHLALKRALERTGGLNQRFSEPILNSYAIPSDTRPNRMTVSPNEERRVRQMRTESYVRSLESAPSRSSEQNVSNPAMFTASPQPLGSENSRGKANRVRRRRSPSTVMPQAVSHSEEETSGEEYEPSKRTGPKPRAAQPQSGPQSGPFENTDRNALSPNSKDNSVSTRPRSRKNLAKRAMNSIPSSFFGDYPDSNLQTPVPLPLPPATDQNPVPPLTESPIRLDSEETNLFVNDDDPPSENDDEVIVVDDNRNDANTSGNRDNSTNGNSDSQSESNFDTELRKRAIQSSFSEPSSPTSSVKLRKRPRRNIRSSYSMPSIAEESSIDNESHTSQPTKDPQSGDVPQIYIVPVNETPRISYRSIDDLDEKTLQETADWSESDSDRVSDIGSVIDMIDDSDDSMAEAKKLLTPVRDMSFEPHSADENDSSSSENSSDEEFVASPTNDIEELAPSETLSVSEARKMRGRRHRVPTLNYWLGERIEYAPEDKLGLLTAVDVRHVVPAVKKYRPRRRRHTQPRARVITQYNNDHESATVPPRPDVQIPVFDARDRQWHTETVAKSVVNDGFTPLINEKGSAVPKVYRSTLFGNKNGGKSPLEVYMLKINAGGLFSRYLESRKSSVYLCWSGKCEIRLNDESFELPKGNAFYAPPANDLHIENIDDGSGFTASVKLYVIEFNGPMSEELVHAMLQGATSMVVDPSSPQDFGESHAPEDNLRAPGSDRDLNATSEVGDTNVLDLDIEPQHEDVDGPNFEYDEGSPVKETPGDQPAPSESRVDLDSALNSRASVDTFIKGFSRAVGNPELSQYSRDSRRNSRFIPTERAASDDEIDDFSAALQLGSTNPRPNPQNPPSSIRDPIRRVQAITRSNLGITPKVPSSSGRLVAESSVDETSAPSYFSVDDGENLLPQITRDLLLERYRQAQQRAEDGEY